MRQIINNTLFITVVMLLIQSTTLAQCTGDNTFTGASDNQWSNIANWCAGCVPAGTITGVISIEADCVVSDANAYTLNNLILADGITFTNNGTGTWTIENVGGSGTYVKTTQTFTGTIEPEYTSPLKVQVDPDGTTGNGDEYTLYVHPDDNSGSIIWGGYGADILGVTNYSSSGTALTDFDGQANTDAIVVEIGAGTTYAAGLCASLSANGCNWYLPALGELKAMYEQLGPTVSGGSNDMPIGLYWSSTEYSASSAWAQGFYTGSQVNFDKRNNNNNIRCRCVRR